MIGQTFNSLGLALGIVLKLGLYTLECWTLRHTGGTVLEYLFLVGRALGTIILPHPVHEEHKSKL